MFFEDLGAEMLHKKIPSKPTIVDGRHIPTEDERTPEWRKQVCDDLAVVCAGLTVSDELVEGIRSDIEYAANFLSVGSRKNLVGTIEKMVRALQSSADE